MSDHECLQCLMRVPCKCQDFPGMKIPDESLIDMATTCSDRGVALRAEIVLRKRYPSQAIRELKERR